MRDLLDPQKALLFRITHAANLRWILTNGLHCPNSAIRDPNFISIGNAELIARRARRVVPRAPGGVLNDYVPFYFTPLSPMLLNIKTGYSGITQRTSEEIVILVSSLATLQEQDVQFVFSDRHAYMVDANFYSDLADLDKIDWGILQNRDFKYDPDDPSKMSRYMAEALAFRNVPISALIGVAVFNERARDRVNADLNASGIELSVAVRANFYF